MFKYKISHQITEETKNLVSTMFLFKAIRFIEIVGFSLLFTGITLSFLNPKPNIFILFFLYLLFVSLIYIAILKLKPKK